MEYKTDAVVLFVVHTTLLEFVGVFVRNNW